MDMTTVNGNGAPTGTSLIIDTSSTLQHEGIADNPLLEAALGYARRGWPVFPVHGRKIDGKCECNNPDCHSPCKHPLTKNGFKDATTDEATIIKLWAQWPTANIAIATGADSGVIVVDVDPRHGGDESLDDLEEKHDKLPDTVEAVTGGGGRHLLYRHPGYRVPNSAGKFGRGLDIRGDGGYIIVAPSIHISGEKYEWEASSHPNDIAIADAPEWLLKLLAAENKTVQQTTHVEEGKIPEGQRNSVLTSLAGSMRRKGAGEAAIRFALLAENGEKCVPPLSESEISDIARNISRYAPASNKPDQSTDDIFKKVSADQVRSPEVPLLSWEALQKNGLTTEHSEYLKAAGLSDATITAAQVQSATADDVTRMIGTQVDNGGLVYPYIDPKNGTCGTCFRVNLLKKWAGGDYASNYLAPKGSKNYLYIPESCAKILDDPSIPLIMATDERSCLRATQDGLHCIAVTGVYEYKDDEPGGYATIQNLDRVNFKHRVVRLICDSDTTRNPDVKLVLNELQGMLRNKMANVEIIFLPPGPRGTRQDLADYLLRKKPESLWTLQHQHTDLQREVYNIRAAKKKPFQKQREVADTIIQYLGEMGYFIHSNNDEPYFFFNPDKKLFFLDKGSEEVAQLINTLSGLSSADSEYKFLLTDARHEAATRGEKTTIRRFSWYDNTNNILYVDNNDNQIYRLNGESVDLVGNGADGVLFRNDRSMGSFEYLVGEDVDGEIDRLILDRLSVDGRTITRDKQQFLLLIYLSSLFFGSLLPTRPILLFTGSKGGGKTAMLKLMGHFLYGSQFNVTSISKEKEDSFVANICNRHFVVFDNVDGKISWLNDALARVATGQTITLRELYTTNSIAAYYPDTFIALSARTPKFRRDDVVERLLVLPTKRVNTNSFINELELLGQIDNNRNALWTEMLNALNEIIAKLPHIRAGHVKKHRMADFADLGFRIAAALGHGDTFLEVLDKQKEIRNAFLLEEDPLLPLISKWVNETSNIDRHVTAGVLHKDLARLALTQEYTYKNSMALAKRLKNIQSELSEVLGVDLEIQPGQDNQNLYIFKKKVPF